MLKKIQVLSRHPSHNVLRKFLPKLNFRSLVRFGSTTIPARKYDVEINSVDSIKISSNKKLMKESFNLANVKTAPWIHTSNPNDVINFAEEQGGFFVLKSFYGSRGRGNYIFRNIDDFNIWVQNKNLSNYIVEKYMPYKLEYRLHVTQDGYFYTCRKALKLDTPEKDRWRRHIDTSIWYREENDNFLKPNSWDQIVSDCVKALNVIKADILSFDVRVQSAFTKKGAQREFQDFVLIECNSASSMSSPLNNEVSYCAEKYLKIIPELIVKKYAR